MSREVVKIAVPRVFGEVASTEVTAFLETDYITVAYADPDNPERTYVHFVNSERVWIVLTPVEQLVHRAGVRSSTCRQ